MNPTFQEILEAGTLEGEPAQQGGVSRDGSPVPAYNPQLFVGSEFEHMQPEDDFFNAKDPNLRIQSERPQHRLILFLKARGHNNREIAQAVGMSESWISQVLRQPWARERLAAELNAAGRDELSNLIETAAKDSLYKLVELRDDEETPKAVAANVSTYLVDRFLGKPKQSIEQKVGQLDQLTDEQLTTIISRAGITPTSAN